MNPLTISIHSFSYTLHGIPSDRYGHRGGFVFDCRCLPNPGREDFFVHLTGLDPQVAAYLDARVEVHHFLSAVFTLLDSAIENYNSRGFEHLMVCFGCTGGQHRSVYCADRLASYLRSKGHPVEVEHHSLHRES